LHKVSRRNLIKLCNLVALGIVAQSTPTLPAWAAPSLSPNDKQMVFLSLSGGRWGGVEGAFAAHCFSLKSSRGNAIWRDSSPESILLVNPENSSYISMSLEEYADDVSHHGHRKRIVSTESKPIKLAGQDGLETTIKTQNRQGQINISQKVIALNAIKLPAKMSDAWDYIMASPAGSGFVVSLYSTKGGHQDYQDGTDRRGSYGKKPLRPLVEFHSVKLLPVQKERFEVPKNYKVAADKASFYFSPEGQALKKEDIDDLFRSSTK
jgi:hypothetical protein